MITPELIVSLLLILAAAWTLGYVFTRLGLPAVMGELMAGVLLGPAVLGLVAPSPSIELIAEMGIFFVMFHTGLELDPKELLQHFWPSLSVAVGGFVLPFAMGYFSARLFGGTLYQSLFVGMGVSITAIAVQAIILHSMKINRTDLGHIIIGAAIADDILALIAFSTLLGLARTGSLQLAEVSWIFLKVAAFFGATILVGQFVLPKFTKKLHDREGKAFTFALVSAFIMAYFAELAGLHIIIGAFLAGQFIRKEIMDENIFHTISDRFYGISYGFLVPIFFASLSFHLHFYADWGFVVFSAALIAFAVAGKLLGCGLGYMVFRRNWREGMIVGFGMNGRGAVELVVASVVIKLSDRLLSEGAISESLLTEQQFSALVLMAFVTTIIAPLTLKWSVLRTCKYDEKTTFCQLWPGP
ncbi:MAG: cation:proton antiporter [Nitrospirota bacterium]